MDDLLDRAARVLSEAEALIITAGAGMGVDSGLPDFRGTEGFWRAYPPIAKLGLSFAQMANPEWFHRDPELAWGFYGHRLNLYRSTRPHEGFAILRDWAERMPLGHFLFTSNVDGQFQRAGFASDRIVEAHGAIDFLQCTRSCGIGIIPADDVEVTVDEARMRARRPLPSCPKCGSLARPNILMFGDWGWDSERQREQGERFVAWWKPLSEGRVAVVECGAGTAVPTVRSFSESLAESPCTTLVRINVREPAVPDRSKNLGIAMGARDALRGIAARLGK